MDRGRARANTIAINDLASPTDTLALFVTLLAADHVMLLADWLALPKDRQVPVH